MHCRSGKTSRCDKFRRGSKELEALPSLQVTSTVQQQVCIGWTGIFSAMIGLRCKGNDSRRYFGDYKLDRAHSQSRDIHLALIYRF